MAKQTKIEELTQRLEELAQKRGTIESELAELRAELAGDVGAGDVQLAVARHRELAAEIAGRESVLRNLAGQVDTLRAELTAAQEEAKKAELATLQKEVESFIFELEDQMLAVLGMAQDAEIAAKIRRHQVLAGPYGLGGYAQYLDRLQGALKTAEERRASERRARK